VCALDLQKAFDKLNKYAVFIKLMQRNCPIVLINLFDCWCSKNLHPLSLSSFVKLKTGTRQGGVISPVLFTVFIDDVLVKLDNSGFGCRIQNICSNAFMYADDLLLLSNTLGKSITR